MISCGKPYLEQEQTFGSPKDKVARWSRQVIDGQDKWLPSCFNMIQNPAYSWPSV